jgi:hypothetical protein
VNVAPDATLDVVTGLEGFVARGLDLRGEAAHDLTVRQGAHHHLQRPAVQHLAKAVRER